MNVMDNRLGVVARLALRQKIRRTRLRPVEQRGDPMFFGPRFQWVRTADGKLTLAEVPVYSRRFVPASQQSPRAVTSMVTES